MRRITIIVLCVILFAVGSATAGTWKDSFDDNKISEKWTPIAWSMTDQPDWKIENGILKGNWPLWNAQMLFLSDYPSPDYTIQVKCRIDKVWQVPELAAAGIIFRSSGPGKTEEDNVSSFYGFGIGDTGARFAVVYGGKWHIMEASPRKHDIGKWYTLKVVVKEGGIFCYVGNELVCKLYGASLDGKFVGLTMGSNISASFDDFLITDQTEK